MEDKIKGKIIEILSRSLDTEAEIVYLMTLIRRLLESYDKRKKYPVLNFYCNWVLHYKIENISAPEIKKIFEKIDESMGGKYDPTFMEEFLSLEPFRKEAELFFKKCDIPESLFIFQNNGWIKFRKKLTDLLSISPVEINLDYYKSMNIKKIKFLDDSKSKDAKEISCIIELRDRPKFNVSFCFKNY